MHHKKARLTLKLVAGDTTTHTAGTKIAPGDILVTVPKATIREFNLAKILTTTPPKALSMLTVHEGDFVEAGVVFARKKGLLRRKLVKTSAAGVFRILDEKKALVGFEKKKERNDIVAWFHGTVVEVTDEHIIFELTGQTLSGTSGKGHPVSGKLIVLTDTVDALTLPSELEERILALKIARAEIIAKADTLGVGAIIAEEVHEPTITLPFMQIADIESLRPYHDKTVIVYGDEKQLLIVDSPNKHK